MQLCDQAGEEERSKMGAGARNSHSLLVLAAGVSDKLEELAKVRAFIIMNYHISLCKAI